MGTGTSGFGGSSAHVGGEGFDTLVLPNEGMDLDLTAIDNGLFKGIERIDMRHADEPETLADLAGSEGAGNTLTLAIDDVLDFSDTTDELQVLGDPGVDKVVVHGGAWQAEGEAATDDAVFAVWTSQQGDQTARLLVEQGVATEFV